MKSLVICSLVALASIFAFASIDGATTACTPGTWTTSIENARKVGKQNKRFIAIAWGKSEGCGFCNSAAENVFNKAEFKQWSKDNGIPILWVDDLDASSCSEWIWNKYYGGKAVTFAQFLVIDPSNNDNLLLKALFQGSTVQYGETSKTSSKVTDCPNAWLMSPFNPKQTIGLVDWILRGVNNSAAKALSVVPDVRDVSSPTVNRLWNSYGLRSLSCVNLWSSSSVIPKIALITHAEDQFDWFKFEVKTAGAYEVKLQDYVDSLNEGQLYVFQDAATAKSVATYAEAAAKAMASSPMSTIDEQGGWKFGVPAAGTYYLLFTRPDSEKCKQKSTAGKEYDGYVEKTLEYNFTLQETDNADSCDYWFDGWLALSADEGTTNELRVTRSESKLKGSVNIMICNKDEMTDIPLAKPEIYAAAVKGAPGIGDFYLIDADGNVLSEVSSNKYACSFAAGQETSSVRIVFNRGASGIQKQDRAFGVRLDVKTEETEAHYHETFVTIEDADKPINEMDGALNATEVAQSTETNKFSLIGSVVSHDYFFTNVTHETGSVYCFFVQAYSANDFADGRLKVEVIRTSTGERLVPVASNRYDAATSTLPAGDSGAWVTYTYGTDSVNGFGPDNITTDVIIRVSREAAAPGEFPDVRYWMKWQRFDRPVVSFDKPGISFATEERPMTVATPVSVDTLSGIKSFLSGTSFAIDVAWKTVSGTGSAAVENVDYKPVTDGLDMFTVDEGPLTVDLCEQKNLSYPTRSFALQLQDDANQIYVVNPSASTYTVTLLEDNVKPSSSVVVDISKTGWQSTGGEDRILSYTNVVDWITITNVQASCYEYEHVTNYCTTVVTNVHDYEIVEGTGVTNFVATVDSCQTNFQEIVGFDGTVSNDITEVSGMTEFVTNILTEVVEQSLREEKAAELARKLWVTNTVVDSFVSPSAERVAKRTYYRLKTDSILAMPAGAEKNVRVDVYTNGAPSSYSFTLGSLQVEESQTPVLYFDKLDDGMVKLRVSREEDESVRIEYKMSMREWEKPVIRFGNVSVITNDTLASFSIPVLREGNTADAIVVGLSSSNETVVAGSGYFTVPETLSFTADAEREDLEVTVTDCDWNATNWTGDRKFAIRLYEIADVGAFEFAAQSNEVSVTLADTNKGLDAGDEKDDDTRVTGATPEKAVEISADGGATNLVRTLNGTTLTGYAVNDTNDWFRFSSIVSNETYLLTAKDCETNVPVRVALYRGEETSAFADIALDELIRGYRYDAMTNADIVVCVYRDQTEKLASVRYTFSASRYIWPVVGFTTSEIVVTNTITNAQLRTETTVYLEAYRHFNTNSVVEAAVSAACTVSGWGNTDYLVGVDPSVLEFLPAEAVTNEVVLGINKIQGAWVGDWTFNVSLGVDENWVRYGEITNVLVRVVDGQMPAKDPTDGPDGDDSREGAAELDLGAGSVVSTNHLNGIDVEHEGVLSTDTNDWFKLTGLVPENTYRISISQYVDNNTYGLDLNATIESETVAKTVTFLSLRNGQYLDVPYAGEGDIYIKMERTTCDQEKPVSVAYALKVDRIDWPKFDITAKEPTVRNDAVVAKAVVTRSDNLDQKDTVVVRVIDDNAVKVVADPSFETNVVFAVGETSRMVEVGLVPAETGFWKRGGDFTFVLERDDEHPYVTLGETNAVVTVTDASGIPENDYSTDDTEDGAQEYLLDVVAKTATEHLAQGQSVAWLNGRDLVDWYRLTGAKAGNRYRIGITAFGSVNAEKYPATIMIAPEGVSRTAEVIGKNNVWEWDYVPEHDGDIMVKIARAQDDLTKDVSVKYLLTFRQLASAYVKFQKTEQTVSGAASVVYVDVECIVDAGEVLFDDAVIKVLPTENAETNNSAKAGIGFDARPITLTWAEGSTGGVQRIAVPIGGSSATWKGDETFILVLSNEVDSVEIAAPENGGEMCVTVTDVATPVYGSVVVSAVGVNDEAPVPVASVPPFSVREGDSVTVLVMRTGGQAGRVDGVWRWMNGKSQVGESVKTRLFDGVTSQESTTVEVPLTVPTTAGYQATRTLTLNLFLNETAKVNTEIKFSVEDKEYEDTISAYSADDPAKVAFRASGSTWFLDRDGGIRAALEAKKIQTTSAMVTGPGTLHFDATVAGGCELTVKVGSQIVKTLTVSEEDASVRIDANGMATVSFLCASPKSITIESACAVSDVRFDRDDSANRYGTFNGRALVNGIPGAATLTVSKTGKISGKISCADRTWTFAPTNGWNDADNFTITLKSGRVKLEDITFQLKPATGEVLAYVKDEREPIAILVRNVWGDKPLSADAAWVCKHCTGYLTAVMAPETTLLGDPLYGSGYCGLTVSKSGVVKAAGRLADGQAVSVGGTLVPGEGACAKTFLFAKPSAYRGGWYFASPTFVLRDFGAEGEKVVVTNAVLDLVLDHAKPWTSSGAGVAFERQPDFVGGWYDKTENLYNHYSGAIKVVKVDSVSDLTIGGKTYAASAWATDEEHPVSLSFNEAGSRLLATCGGDARLFSVSLTRSTGLFSGYFRAVYDCENNDKVRSVTKSSAYRGMLIPYAPESEKSVGRGYFLMSEPDVETGKNVNKSYDVEIME